jgi:glyoxylase-like metal-dependent hydrolase (beta-lactamase superfamily II)
MMAFPHLKFATRSAENHRAVALALGFAGVGEQRASVRRVRAQRFDVTVVVPGHGRRCGIVAAQLQGKRTAGGMSDGLI